MKKVVCILLASIMMLSINGCKKTGVNVCVTSYPIEYVVNRIAADTVNVCNISDTSTIMQRSHIVETYKASLTGVHALWYIGELEPYMEIYMNEINQMNINLIDLSIENGIYDFVSIENKAVNGKETIVKEAYYTGSEFEYVNTYHRDPMLWMDLITMTNIAANIRDYFIAEYPENRALYEDNYEQLELELAALDVGYRSIKEEQMHISFASMTPSFGIWQEAYGIHVLPVVVSKYGVLPNEEQINSIERKMIDRGIKYMVVEDDLPADMVELQERIVTDLGLIKIEMHNLALVKETEEKDYIQQMYENLKMLESMAE